MFCTDALENVLVFLAVKAAQGVPTEDIQPNGFADLVPELFKPNRGVRLTFRPKTGEHSPQATTRGCSRFAAFVAASMRPFTTSKNRAASGMSLTMKVESTLATSN